MTHVWNSSAGPSLKAWGSKWLLTGRSADAEAMSSSSTVSHLLVPAFSRTGPELNRFRGPACLLLKHRQNGQL